MRKSKKDTENTTKNVNTGITLVQITYEAVNWYKVIKDVRNMNNTILTNSY